MTNGENQLLQEVLEKVDELHQDWFGPKAAPGGMREVVEKNDARLNKLERARSGDIKKTGVLGGFGALFLSAISWFFSHPI